MKDADEEAFEDNAEEYMRRDVEGSGIWPVFAYYFLPMTLYSIYYISLLTVLHPLFRCRQKSCSCYEAVTYMQTAEAILDSIIFSHLKNKRKQWRCIGEIVLTSNL